MTTAEIPDDIKTLAAELRAPREIVISGGALDLRQLLPKLSYEKQLQEHVERWERFVGRWRSNARLSPYTQDMRLWEARKARIDLADSDRRAWFWSISPASRMELVRLEQERIAAERRFKLARQRLSKESMKNLLGRVRNSSIEG